MSPDSKSYRMTILALASLILFGSYFAYDSVAAIEQWLIEQLGADQAAIGRMYTWYSVAAIFAVLGGGILIDRIGTRRASLLFSLLVTAGAAIVAWAPSVGWMYFGRLVFGMGSEPLVVAQSAILARWFRGKELALSFGVALTVSRLGTLFTFNTEGLVAERYGWRQALWLAVALCAASVVANLLYNVLDKRAEGPLGLKEEAAGDRIEWGKIAGFSRSYWYVVLLCVTFYSAIFPFTALSTNFFREKWGLATASGEGLSFFQGVFYNLTHMFSTAQGTTSIVITASMFFAPFAGRLVDRIGRRATLMIVGSLLMIPAHLALGFGSAMLPPAIPMIVLGAAFVLVPAAMWPSVPLVVDKDRVGTAFGLMTAIQNVGLMAFPLLNGALRVSTGSYTASQLMFASLGACGLVFALLLRASDRRSGNILEKPTPKAA